MCSIIFYVSNRSFYIYPQSTDWLTDLSVRIMLLETLPGGNIILWSSNSYKISGSKSPGQRCFEAKTWEFFLYVLVYIKYVAISNKMKTFNLSRVLSVCNLKIFSRGQKRAGLSCFFLASSSVIQICPIIFPHQGGGALWPPPSPSFKGQS